MTKRLLATYTDAQWNASTNPVAEAIRVFNSCKQPGEMMTVEWDSQTCTNHVYAFKPEGERKVDFSFDIETDSKLWGPLPSPKPISWKEITKSYDKELYDRLKKELHKKLYSLDTPFLKIPTQQQRNDNDTFKPVSISFPQHEMSWPLAPMTTYHPAKPLTASDYFMVGDLVRGSAGGSTEVREVIGFSHKGVYECCVVKCPDGSTTEVHPDWLKRCDEDGNLLGDFKQESELWLASQTAT